MVTLSALWLPILLSAVFVFLASSVLHMLLPIHKGDFSRLPDEDAVRAALRSHGLQPGQYAFPYCTSMQEMGSDEMRQKWAEGPIGFMNVLPNGSMAMGKSLMQWFLYSLLISVIVAYVATLGLDAGSAYGPVFRMTGTVAIMAYGLSYFPDPIWKGGSWTVAMKFLFDGAVYGLITAGTFGWLWPVPA